MRRLLRFWDVGKRLWELAALILAVQDPRVDGRARAIVALVIVYALLPVDIVPEFIPFAGVIDDLLLGWLGLSRAAALVPPEVMQEHRLTAQRAGKKVKRVLIALSALGVVWLAAAIMGIVMLVRWLSP